MQMRQTDRQTDRRTDRHAYRQTETDIETERQRGNLCRGFKLSVQSSLLDVYRMEKSSKRHGNKVSAPVG